MKRHYRRNSLNQDLIGLGGTSMIIGTGSMMAGAINAPAGIKESFSVAGSFMPFMAATTMTKHIIKQTKRIR